MLHRRSFLAFATLTSILAFAGSATAQSTPQPVHELLDGFGSMAPNACPGGEQPVVNSLLGHQNEHRQLSRDVQGHRRRVLGP